MTLLTWLICGLALTSGLVGLVWSLIGTTAPPKPGLRQRLAARPGDADERRRLRNRAAIGAVLGLAVWLVSGVFVGGAMTALAVPGVPWLLASTKSVKARIEKLEALGEWLQRLADVLRGGKGLEQALIDSRTTAPAALSEQIGDLAARLHAGWPPEEALRSLADAFDDVTADKAMAVLILSADGKRGPGLAQALEDFADSVREEVAKRRSIEADRAKSRTTVRWMTLITLGVVAGGYLVPGYTAPYGTLLGQLVLGALAAAFAAVLVWMRQLADHTPVPRFLIVDPRSRVRTPAADPATPEAAGAEVHS